jgi:Zn-dependent M28 family amino/carboxypeptidase
MRKKPGIGCVWLVAAWAMLVSSALSQEARPDIASWQGKRALADIARQLSFGVRAIETPGHRKTIEYIERELRASGASPVQQRFSLDVGGENHALVNIIARFYPDNPRRILLGTHYDSIIRAYRDKRHPDAPMPGANNSASGVALLLETARALKAAKSPPPYGIDLVFFDGEEGPLALGGGDRHWRPLGSPYFAAHLDDFYPAALPEKAAIFDMVCWRAQKLRPERASLLYAGAEVDKFWAIGRHFAPQFFSDEPTRLPIFDDQIALDQAKIPAFLVIGFEYEPWFNTTGDTLDKCSEAAMNAVGRTLIRYIYAP